MVRKYDYMVIAKKVLVVAMVNYSEDGKLRDWSAYCDSVRGQNHNLEYMEVAQKGDKIPKELSFFVFPNLPKDKWRP